jgi:hypothetical protein
VSSSSVAYTPHTRIYICIYLQYLRVPSLPYLRVRTRAPESERNKKNRCVLSLCPHTRTHHRSIDRSTP